ncbi:MAG TPA: cytochrome c biogenesis CcdA family protein, partial [Acidimicrobiales bacterium]|nr:cytochrome c biogenesis CcdA family protein [Acidimicrobiales bacterium]
MIDVSFAYAFTVGMVVVVNPCGFPMLPAYLSYFTSLDDDVDAAGDWTTRLGRGIRSGLAVAAGFLTVFGVLAVPINAGITEIYEVMPWLTIVIGVALAALGVLMLAGRKPVIVLPRLDRGGRTKGTGSMVLYGVSYAVASLGCSLPVMVALVSGTTQRSNLASGLLWFASYAAGATSVLVAVSVALALARGSLVRLLRASLRHVDRASGVLLVLVGAYLVWYGVFAAGSASSAITPFDWVEDQSASWTVRLQEGGADLGLALVAG